MTLKVGLNGLFLHYPRSGSGRYLHHLIEGSRDLVDLSVIGARVFPTLSPTRDQTERLVSTPFDGRAPRLAKIWFEQVGFGFVAKRLDVDVAHVPYFGSGIWCPVSTVVTVHDLVSVLLPEYRRSAGERLYASLATRGLRYTSAIITDSDASARDLQANVKVPAGKIHVIPLGVDTRFRPLRTLEAKQWASRRRLKLAVSPPYLLYVGGFDRRKNLNRLIAAFARLKIRDHIPHSLVLVGAQRTGPGLFYDPRSDIERLGLGDSVILLGDRTDDDVRALHDGADAFVFPSTYEGFGLPPLEAMAMGTPVVCSNASSLPEVIGDAGILCNPFDVESIADAVARVIQNSELRKELRNRGVDRAAMFSWHTTVRKTVDVYRSVALGTT